MDDSSCMRANTESMTLPVPVCSVVWHTYDELFVWHAVFMCILGCITIAVDAVESGQKSFPASVIARSPVSIAQVMLDNICAYL